MKKQIWILIVIIVVIAIGSVSYFYLLKTDEITESVEESSVGVEPAVTGEAVTIQQLPKETKTEQKTFTAADLEVIIKRSKLLDLLPKNAVFAISFFDGSGNPIPGSEFTIDEKGNVKEGLDENYEVRIMIGNYRIPELIETPELCDAFQRIYDEQDLLAESKISWIKALLRYRSLKKCVKFEV